MPAKNHLSQEQKEILIGLLKEAKQPYIREKALIILLITEVKALNTLLIEEWVE